jgi:hypothetical protein
MRGGSEASGECESAIDGTEREGAIGVEADWEDEGQTPLREDRPVCLGRVFAGV